MRVLLKETLALKGRTLSHRSLRGIPIIRYLWGLQEGLSERSVEEPSNIQHQIINKIIIIPYNI